MLDIRQNISSCGHTILDIRQFCPWAELSIGRISVHPENAHFVPSTPKGRSLSINYGNQRKCINLKVRTNCSVSLYPDRVYNNSEQGVHVTKFKVIKWSMEGERRIYFSIKKCP